MSKQFTAYFPPLMQRIHEVCGAGADFFAFSLAAHIGGPVLWVREKWRSDQINPVGFAKFIKPSDVLIAYGKDQPEILAISEEALRSNSVKLVIMEISQPLDLTLGRRLQLAARDGETTGLALIPDGMGSNAAETRWHCAPLFDAEKSCPDSTLQSWSLIKNKKGTIGAWHVRWDDAAHRVIMVSSVSE